MNQMDDIKKNTDKKPAEVFTGLKLLRQPFAKNQIGSLARRGCTKQIWENAPKGKCDICDGYHSTARAVHLDYVGHAALTDRLLDCDEKWSWEPLSLASNGLPQLCEIGGLWIKLTVCGVTRLGYGNADGKQGGNARKELIGDALRNAAMRFGAALDLWHKGDLHIEEEDETPPPAVEVPPQTPPSWNGPLNPENLKIETHVQVDIMSALKDKGTMEQLECFIQSDSFRAVLDQCKVDAGRYYEQISIFIIKARETINMRSSDAPLDLKG